MSDAKTLTVEIVTPEKRVFSGVAELVIIPGLEGEFGVMQGHAAILSALAPGVIKVVTDGKTEYYVTQGGFAEVLGNTVTLVVETAEPSGSLNYESVIKEYDAAVKEYEQATEQSVRDLAHTRVRRLQPRLKVVQLLKSSGR